MDEDMSELINKINSIVNNNSNNTTHTDNTQNLNNQSVSGNSSLSPEMISRIVEMLNNKSANNNKTSSPNKNLDIETILKLKTVFEKINSKNDPRSNLLLALKPYLKDSRKQKIEQYIQLFNVSKFLDEFGPMAGGDLHK